MRQFDRGEAISDMRVIFGQCTDLIGAAGCQSMAARCRQLDEFLKDSAIDRIGINRSALVNDVLPVDGYVRAYAKLFSDPIEHGRYSARRNGRHDAFILKGTNGFFRRFRNFVPVVQQRSVNIEKYDLFVHIIP